MSGNITTGKGWLTVPVLFFHEAEGLTISVEVKDGTLYRGRAERTEDNFSVSLSDATATSPTGEVTTLQRVYIRGNRIVFVVFPDVLERAPIFDRVRRTSEGTPIERQRGPVRIDRDTHPDARAPGAPRERRVEGSALAGPPPRPGSKRSAKRGRQANAPRALART